MKIQELKDDLLIQEWFQTLNPTPNTIHNYLRSFQSFTEWIDETPSELLIEAEEDIRAEKLM